jgi:hypothetical protein
VDGGLLVPGRPRRAAADLSLTVDGASVSAGDAVLELAWDRPPTRAVPTLFGSPFPNAWALSGWTHSNVGPIGVAMFVGSDYYDAATAVREATKTWLNRCNQGWAQRWKLPLHRMGVYEQPSSFRVCETVAALCVHLQRHKERRELLADPHRMQCLLDDIRSKSVHARAERTGARRSTMEILTAMRMLKIANPLWGRPVEGEAMPDRWDTIDRVRDYLARSPYAKNFKIDRGDVDEVLSRDYFDVTPWPFAALA